MASLQRAEITNETMVFNQTVVDWDLSKADSSELPLAGLYGYGVYTSFKTPISNYWLLQHIRRLSLDAVCLGIPFPQANERVFAEYLYPRLRKDKIYRLTLYPDVRHFSDLLQEAMPGGSRLIISEFKLPMPSFSPVHVPVTSGLRLKTVQHDRTMSGIKHTALAETFYLKRQAVLDGFDDFLWLNADETIAEASTGNVFGVMGNTLLTPSVSKHHCLPGITRHQIIQIAARLTDADIHFKIKVEQTDLRAFDLASLEGLFLTNAVRGIQPVSLIEDEERQIPIAWTEQARMMVANLQLMLSEIQQDWQPADTQSVSPIPKPQF